MKNYNDPMMKISRFGSEAATTASETAGMQEWSEQNGGAKVYHINANGLKEIESLVEFY